MATAKKFYPLYVLLAAAGGSGKVMRFQKAVPGGRSDNNATSRESNWGPYNASAGVVMDIAWGSRSQDLHLFSGREPSSLLDRSRVARHSETARSLSSQSHISQPVAIHEAGGNFDGARFFAEALLKDLDANVRQQLDQCNVNLRSLHHYTPKSDPKPRIWIVVEIEDFTGKQAVEKALSGIGKSDRVILLGNMWDFHDQRQLVRGDRFTSMWAHWGSLHFAERRKFTPMDLFDRTRTNFSAAREGSVAYMQTSCDPFREKFFDVLSETLSDAGQPAGSALGNCRGEASSRRRSSFQNKDGVHCDDTCASYDKAVGRYQDFNLVLAFEHLANEYGFVTEKAYNALLAGAIPIVDTTSQLKAVVNPASFLEVNVSDMNGFRDGAAKIKDILLDKVAFERMQRAPAVSEDSLRKYFSWHPAVWKTHGDEMRMNILKEVLFHCETIGKKTDEEEDVAETTDPDLPPASAEADEYNRATHDLAMRF